MLGISCASEERAARHAGKSLSRPLSEPWRVELLGMPTLGMVDTVVPPVPLISPTVALTGELVPAWRLGVEGVCGWAGIGATWARLAPVASKRANMTSRLSDSVIIAIGGLRASNEFVHGAGGRN